MHEGEPDEVNLRDKDSSDQSHNDGQLPNATETPEWDRLKLEKSLTLHVRKSILRNIEEFGRKKGVSIYK